MSSQIPSFRHFQEAALPPDYRRQLVNCVLAPVSLERSVQVVGLAGMGKSMLLRYLVTHGEVAAQKLGRPAAEIIFLYIDCHKLYPSNALNFYRECLLSLKPDQDLAALGDDYLLYKQLELALRGLESQARVIMVVDHFAALYGNIGPEFFNQLRNLRADARGGQLSYVFGSQHPFDHFHGLERLFSDVCWVGPLGKADLDLFFAQHGSRLGFEVVPVMQQKLWQLTGGHSGLLKHSIEWLKRQAGAGLNDGDALLAALVQYRPIRENCRALWQSLDQQAQQRVLVGLRREEWAEGTDQLAASGLLSNDQGQWRLFSPLWRAYLSETALPQQTDESMAVDLEPSTGKVVLTWGGAQAETVITRPLVFDLLALLNRTPNHLVTKDKILEALHPEDEGYEVMEGSLFQLISALRGFIDPCVEQLCPHLAGSCIENVRGRGYRLLTSLPQD